MSCKVFLDALKEVSETVVKHNDPDVVIEMQQAIKDALTAVERSSRERHLAVEERIFDIDPPTADERSSRKELVAALKRIFEVACRINDPSLASEVLKSLDDAIAKVQSGSW